METPTSPRFRRLGIFLFVIALLATVFAAAHLGENLRGKKKWESYQRKLIAQGTKLDLAAFVPPPIPAEQNFAATPFFAELLRDPRRTNWNRWPDPTFSKVRPPSNEDKRNERQLTDLAAWQMAWRAQTGGDTNLMQEDRAKAAAEVLAALKVYEPVFEELRAASERPLSRYDIRYDMENPWGILLPHLAILKQVCQMLSLKACAELAAGNSEQAMRDVRLILRVTDSTRTELFLITYMLRVACFQIALQPVWEGLALDRWSDPQLEELQRLMLGYNFIDELRMPFGAEQAAGILTVDILMRQRDKATFLAALTGQPSNIKPAGNFVAWFIPRGWYYQEQHNYVRMYQEFVSPGADGTNRIIYPSVIDGNEARMHKLLDGAWSAILSHHVFAKLLLPAVGKTHRKAALAQTAAHQATIACALERYRRAHGSYPKNLALLEPQYLTSIPHDVVGGKPFHYKSAKPIAVYSVGWDEKDNGGTPGETLWAERGDWVWTYPAQ